MNTQNAISPINIISGKSVALLHSTFNRKLAGVIAINARFNLIGGNPAATADTSQEEIEARIRHQAGLISEEAEETLTALMAGDKNEVRDGLADLLVTVSGLFHRAYPTEAHSWEFDTFLIPGPVFYPTETLMLCINSISNIGAAFKQIAHEGREIDKDQLRQACYHLMTFINLFASICGIPLEQDHAAVSLSNLSKFDIDLANADLSAAKYEALGLKVEIRNVDYDGVSYHVVVCAEDQEVDGKFYPKGKILKSINFQEPSFEEASIVLPVLEKKDEEPTSEMPQVVEGDVVPAGQAVNDDAQ